MAVQRRLVFLGVVLAAVSWWSSLLAQATTTETSIVDGTHPSISILSKDGEGDPLDWLKVTVREKEGEKQEFLDAPRYFLYLDDANLEPEIRHRVEFGRWSDRVLLEKLFCAMVYGQSEVLLDMDVEQFPTPTGWSLENRTSDYCEWEGIGCHENTQQIMEIKLDSMELGGTLPEDLYLLADLENLSFRDNILQGTIPESWGNFTKIKILCLADNNLVGTIPETLRSVTTIEFLFLSENGLTGTIPNDLIEDMRKLRWVDLSTNQLTSTIPESFFSTTHQKLMNIFLDDNQLTGSLPSDVTGLPVIHTIDVGQNQLHGTIPSSWFTMKSIRELLLSDNKLSGTIPPELFHLTVLEALAINGNALTGTLPSDHWSTLDNLDALFLNDNDFQGTIPPGMINALSLKLQSFDIANNDLTGTIPTEVSRLSNLLLFDAENNRLRGTIPQSFNRLPNLHFNLTGNLLTGTVPKIFCGAGPNSENILHRDYGCDAVICPAGTFHPYGAATLEAGCRKCPTADESTDPPETKILGRLTCPGENFVNGDLDGDGSLSAREILRLFYMYTAGEYWGGQFLTWADMEIGVCELTGVQCVGGAVAKIDLTDAAICSNGERKAGAPEACMGIPSELALLSDLEVLSLNRRQFLRGTLPTELGTLSRLKYLDVSGCPLLTGTIPTELGRLSYMQYLNLGGCGFTGKVPDELYMLTNMDKLFLSLNALTGTMSTLIGNLTNLKELMWSRTAVTGTLPEELGQLKLIENLEVYGNEFSGSLPSSLSNCPHLKRMDLFNNKLTSTIPESLASLQNLQIFHAKMNELTGTISPRFGELPFLSWFDVSSNRMHGTIPATFGNSRSIKDFRVGQNMIYEPIPQSLCTNTNINGGLTRMYGCDGVICPLGTYSDPGHATHNEGCKPCPEGKTTMYLGSSQCEHFSEADILSIFFDALQGHKWKPEQKRNWKDTDVSVCDWGGITCDEDGRIESISLPLGDPGDTQKHFTL